MPEPGARDAHPAKPSSTAQAPGAAGLGSAVRALSGMTLLSRFLGMLRDVLLVRIFGDTAIGSAFAAGFLIPNTFRRLFGEGALSAAFIPEYTSALKGDTGESKARAGRLAALVLMALGLVTSAITILTELVLLALLLFTTSTPEQRLSMGLIMTMLPFMPLVCLAAIKSGMLQVHGRFAASMTGSIVLNGFILAVGGYFLITGGRGGEAVAYILGVATVFSGVAQLLYFSRLLRQYVRLDFSGARHDPETRASAKRMLSRFLPVMLGLGTLQLNTFIDTLIAMWPIWFGPTMLGRDYPLDESSNAILSFTQRLYQFPLGVFGIAVATAAFPMLSRAADDPREFAAMLRRGLRLSFFIGLPASVGLVLVREDITWVFFGPGKAPSPDVEAAANVAHSGFSLTGLARSADVLMGFAAGIWAYSINHLLTRGFYAKGDTKTPMRISMLMVAINIALNFTLIWSLKEAGLAWSTSITAAVQCAILLVLTRRRLVSEPILDAATIRGLARILAITLVMGALVYLVLHFADTGARSSWTAHALTLAAAVAAGGFTFLCGCYATRAPELGWLLARGK